jgi:hypothetical protein
MPTTQERVFLSPSGSRPNISASTRAGSMTSPCLVSTIKTSKARVRIVSRYKVISVLASLRLGISDVASHSDMGMFWCIVETWRFPSMDMRIMMGLVPSR